MGLSGISRFIRLQMISPRASIPIFFEDCRIVANKFDRVAVRVVHVNRVPAKLGVVRELQFDTEFFETFSLPVKIFLLQCKCEVVQEDCQSCTMVFD